MFLVPTNFKFTTKEKILMILIMVLMLMGIVVIWRDYAKNIKTKEAYAEAYKKNQEEIIRQMEEAERKRQEKLPKLTEQGIENVKHIYCSDTKRVFLTFDDGPSTNTNQLLDILKERKIKATFFVLGSNVEKNPQTIKRIYEEGHFIANHGYSHIYENIYASPEAVLEEYNRCSQLIKDALEEPEYESHLFRFPGGLVGGKYADIKSKAKELLLQNNIVHVDWNSLNGDSETQEPTIEYELQRVRETVENKQSAVILMHDAEAKKVTVEALPQIIDYLIEQGYEFKNFYEIIK